MQSEKICLYNNRDDVTLTTYILSDSNNLIFPMKRPAVLICPGGGYLKCASQEAEPVALRFAAMGYHTFVLRYSTYFGDNDEILLPKSKNQIKVKEHCIFPKPTLEIGKAFLLIRENAEKWNLDEERIALCGFSAGAHNVAMYSSLWNSSLFSEYFEGNLSKFRPHTVILGYIAGDFYFKKMNDIPREKEMFFRMSYTAIFGKQDIGDEDIALVSPSLHVNRDNPPTFFWGTCEDNLVSVKNTLKLAEAYAKKRIPFEMHIFEEGSHGLSLGTQASAKIKKQINKDAAKWMELVEAWLQKRMAIELSE